MTGTIDRESNNVDLSEAARQLEQAAHDARVAFDCLALEDSHNGVRSASVALEELDRAHTHTITARAAVDAAENVLRVALGGDGSIPGP